MATSREGLADVMAKATRRDEAIALLKEGLEKAPGAAALQERLNKLQAGPNATGK